MERADFIKTVRSYDLDPKDFVISGSGPLCVLFPDLFEATDIDLIVSERLFDDLSHRSGWCVEHPPAGANKYETRLVSDDGFTEGFCAWKLGTTYIPFRELRECAHIHEALLLMPLWLVRLYKLMLRRTKDRSALSFLDRPVPTQNRKGTCMKKFARMQ
jgi:hypothetical protein